jgi:hypothetical protein
MVSDLGLRAQRTVVVVRSLSCERRGVSFNLTSKMALENVRTFLSGLWTYFVPLLIFSPRVQCIAYISLDGKRTHHIRSYVRCCLQKSYYVSHLHTYCYYNIL